MRRIVVGVDGSEDSRRALVVALEEARVHEAELEVVYAAAEPSPYLDPIVMPQSMPSRQELRDAASSVIDEMLAGIDLGRVPTERVAAIGSAARVLCDASTEAGLLVVGSRGLGGFRGLLVGSVSQHLVAHSHCPVLLVVPEER